MAQASNTFETYDAKGNRETLADVIHQTTPEETPFLSFAGTRSIKGEHPEWQIDALDDIDLENNQEEGQEWSFPQVDPTDRVGNYAQISNKPLKISGTQEVVDKAGRSSEVKYQVVKKGKELKIDMEAILLSNQASSAGSGNGTGNRKSGGLRAWIATNDNMNSGSSGGFNSGTGVVDAATNGTQRAFTKAILDDVILNTYNSGGEVGRSTMFVSPYVKQVFSGFMDESDVAQPRTMYDKKKNTIIASADAYRSDFGTVMVVPNRQMKRAGATVARNAFLVDPEYVSVGMLRDIHIEKPAKTGDAHNRVIQCEYSLLVDNEAHLGCAADLYGLTAST